MSEDFQLPAAIEHTRLDVSVRAKLKEVDYDERIIDAVEVLGEVGIVFARNSTPRNGPGRTSSRSWTESRSISNRNMTYWFVSSQISMRRR